MRRLALFTTIAVLCAVPSFGQNASIAPLQISAGTVVDFQLQSRLTPSATDPADSLPAGTALHIKLLNSIDSHVDRDGSAFEGVLLSPVEENNHVILGANAQVRGLFALLRSQRHPEGFRYELLVTNVIDGGKSYVVTASLDHSLFESPNNSRSVSNFSSPAAGVSNVSSPN